MRIDDVSRMKSLSKFACLLLEDLRSISRNGEHMFQHFNILLCAVLQLCCLDSDDGEDGG